MSTIATTGDWVGETLAGGRYQVAEKLGEGGMGHVYRARDQNLLVDVVIKAPRPELLGNGDVTDRFAAEIRSLVHLAHPHIVRIIDVGHHQSVPFAVMQYLSGGSLEDRARVKSSHSGSRTTISPESLRDWLQDLAQALDFIHKMNYVHRDVKPANVLFDAHNNVYLGDFGVAKAAAAISEHHSQRGLTRPGMALGTPEYMAPELIKGDPYAGASDQYSLAVTVYDLLAGRLPYEGPTAAAILIKQMTETPPPLNELRPEVSRGLSRAILKGMSRDPGERYPDCATFASTVVEQISARPGGSSGNYAAVPHSSAPSTPSAPAKPVAALIAARLIAATPPHELAQDVRGWVHRWGARLIEADVEGAKLRFDVPGSWFQRLLRKEEFFLADLAFATLQVEQTRVDMTISYQGDKQSPAELADQARQIYRMIRESLALSTADSRGATSQIISRERSPSSWSREYPRSRSFDLPSTGASIPRTGATRMGADAAPRSSVGRSAPLTSSPSESQTAGFAIRPSDDAAQHSRSPSQASPSSSPPSSAPAPAPPLSDAPRRQVTAPAQLPQRGPDPSLSSNARRMSISHSQANTSASPTANAAGAANPPPAASLFPSVAMIRLYLNPESDNPQMIVCPVVQVSPKAMTVISPCQLLPADVFVRLPGDETPHLARIVHSTPREDARHQVGLVFASPPANLVKLFGHVNP